MKKWTFSAVACVLMALAACKNDAKPTGEATGTATETITPEQFEAETKQAVMIDSMTQSIQALGEQIQKSSDDLDKAISELPE